MSGHGGVYSHAGVRDVRVPCKDGLACSKRGEAEHRFRYAHRHRPPVFPSCRSHGLNSSVDLRVLSVPPPRLPLLPLPRPQLFRRCPPPPPRPAPPRPSFNERNFAGNFAALNAALDAHFSPPLQVDPAVLAFVAGLRPQHRCCPKIFASMLNHGSRSTRARLTPTPAAFPQLMSRAFMTSLRKPERVVAEAVNHPQAPPRRPGFPVIELKKAHDDNVKKIVDDCPPRLAPAPPAPPASSAAPPLSIYLPPFLLSPPLPAPPPPPLPSRPALRPTPVRYVGKLVQQEYGAATSGASERERATHSSTLTDAHKFRIALRRILPADEFQALEERICLP
eukprot:tig00021012_g16992.t1